MKLLTVEDYQKAGESFWPKYWYVAKELGEDAKNFKTYEQLQQRLNLVLGKAPAPARRVDPETFEDESEGFNAPDITPSKSWGEEVSNFREKAVASSPVEDEDDAMSYFARLAEED